MHSKRHPQPVEDYTQAFLGVSGLLLFMGLWVVAAISGFVWVVLWTAAIDLLLQLVRRGRSTRSHAVSRGG